MTTLLRRRIAILIATTSTALAYAIGFSTPVLNGATLMAFLMLAAGTYTAHRIQRPTATARTHAELPAAPEVSNLPKHQQAA